MENKLIGIEEAIEFIYTLSENDILDTEVAEKLHDIYTVLDAYNEFGIDVFGAERKDIGELYVAVREEDYDMHEKKCKEIINKYKIK